MALTRQSHLFITISTGELLLSNLIILSHGKSPALSLLCHDIKRSTNEFRFLHDPCGPTPKLINETLQFAENVSAYMSLTSIDPLSPRLLLNSGESRRILGCNAPNNVRTTVRLITIHNLYDVGPSPIESIDVEKFYENIAALWRVEEMQPCTKNFPLTNHISTNLEKTVSSELENSWRLHCLEESSTTVLVDDTQSLLQHIQGEVKVASESIFEYIIGALGYSMNPDKSINWHAQAIQFFRLIHVIPLATKRDVASLACNPSRIREFNPLLSENSIEKVKSAIICWLELCVLEDKCDFLLAFKVNIDSNKDFLRELRSSREWHDIFDEVDEILHHRYQLVYSIGAVKPLPQMINRWQAVEAVLHIMKKIPFDGIKIVPNEQT